MSPLNKKLSYIDGRLAAYATLAGAALAAPAIPNADATIIYSGVVNINIPSTTSGVYLNLSSGVFSTAPASAPGWDINPWSSSAFNVWANISTETSNGVISNFTGGTSSTLTDNIPLLTLIDGTWNYGRTNSSETTGPTAFQFNSSNNIVGVRFLNNTTNTINFGWVRFSLSGTAASQPRAIVDYAYDDSGAGILAGAMPEPTIPALLGVMAAGALGVRAWRKRKSA
jgi:hypothetical protein